MEEKEIMSFKDEEGNKDDFEAVARIFLDEKEYLLLTPVEEEAEEEVVEEAPVVEAAPAPIAPVAPAAGGVFKLHIGEGKDINLEIPLGVMGGAAAPVAAAPVAESAAVPAVEEAKKEETKLIRSLTKKHFKIDKVVFGEETKIEGTTLTIRNPEELCKEAVETQELVYDMKLDIITPDRYNEY